MKLLLEHTVDLSNKPSRPFELLARLDRDYLTHQRRKSTLVVTLFLRVLVLNQDDGGYQILLNRLLDAMGDR
jgi:hypothetical protein